MNVGDVIINPYVRPLFGRTANPAYATIYLGKASNGNLRFLDYEGRVGEWVMPSNKEFKVVGHVNIYAAIAQCVDYDEEGEA